jgi:hypothetical protein
MRAGRKHDFFPDSGMRGCRGGYLAPDGSPCRRQMSALRGAITMRQPRPPDRHRSPILHAGMDITFGILQPAFLPTIHGLTLPGGTPAFPLFGDVDVL